MDTIEEIYGRMKEKYTEKTGRELSGSSDMAVRMYTAAAEICSLYVYADWIKGQAFPQTASGENLDNHAAMRGLSRQRGTRARGSITFYTLSPTESSLNVPAETVCYTEYGTRFLTEEAGVIPAGGTSVTVSAVCQTEGEAGNVAPEEITLMAVKPAGVSYCINSGAFTGGSDSETDESLRARIIDSFKSLPNGANAAYYEKEVRQIDGVADVKVLPKNRGAGTVDIVISAPGGLPDDDLKQKVKEKLDEKREICVDIGILSPESENISVKANITAADGYSQQQAAENVKESLNEYFSKAPLGQSVLRAKIGSLIYGSEGVENYELLQPAEDVFLSHTALPILSSMVIGQMGA